MTRTKVPAAVLSAFGYVRWHTLIFDPTQKIQPLLNFLQPMANSGNDDSWLEKGRDRSSSKTRDNTNRHTHHILDLTKEDDDDDDDNALQEAIKLSLQPSISPNDDCEIIDVVKPRSSRNVIDTKGESLKPLVINKDVPEPDSSFPVFSVCSYNVWFVEVHPVKRMQKLASVIISTKPRPLFVGLQEVTPMLRETLFPLLEKAGYQMYCQEIDMFRPYGCAIGVLVREGEESTLRAEVIDKGFEYYRESVMNRGLIWVIAKIMDSARNNSTQHVLFTTTHLESFQRDYPRSGENYTGATQRLSQIRQATKFCTDRITAWRKSNRYGESIRMAIITGDLNWDDERKASIGDDPNLLMTVNQNDSGWVDAWKETNPARNEDGYTYDAKTNPMLGGNLRRRFDRCLIFMSNTDKKSGVHKVSIIGNEAIEGITWEKEIQVWQNGGLSGTGKNKSNPVLPSDHYGLLVVFGGTPASLQDDKGIQKKRKT